MSRALDDLLREIRACRLCAAQLPLGPRPAVRDRVHALLARPHAG